MNTTINAWTLISDKKFPSFIPMLEISEYLDEKYYSDILLNIDKKEWQEKLSDTEKIMTEELGEDYVYEFKRKLLENKYTEATKKVFEAHSIGEDTKKHEAIRNRVRFDYELHTYRPDYQNKTFSKEQILKADEVDIENFIEVNNRGFCCCLFHKEKTASLHITKNKWFCFSCGKKGKTISFIMKHKNLDFQAAVKYLLDFNLLKKI